MHRSICNLNMPGAIWIVQTLTVKFPSPSPKKLFKCPTCKTRWMGKCPIPGHIFYRDRFFYTEIGKIISKQDWHSPVEYIYFATHWNFQLEFVMPRTSQHTRDLPNVSYDYDIWKHPVFRLLLALCRLVGLSKRNIIEPSLTAFKGFPFALVFTCTFTEYIT